jgi:hypothetical protein
MLPPPIIGHHPGTVLPGRIVPDVLAVAALQQCHPVTVFILQKTDYRLFQQIRPLGKIKPGRYAPVYWCEYWLPSTCLDGYYGLVIRR